jgi:hypothetical protein
VNWVVSTPLKDHVIPPVSATVVPVVARVPEPGAGKTGPIVVVAPASVAPDAMTTTVPRSTRIVAPSNRQAVPSSCPDGEWIEELRSRIFASHVPPGRRRAAVRGSLAVALMRVNRWRGSCVFLVL